MALAEPFVRLGNSLRHLIRPPGRKGQPACARRSAPPPRSCPEQKSPQAGDRQGHLHRQARRRLDQGRGGAAHAGRDPGLAQRQVRFLRALIHPRLGGRFWLRLLFRLEERFPHFFGENGQYPLIVIRKPEEA